MAEGPGPVDVSDVDRLETEIARTRERLNDSLEAVQAEVRLRLDPAFPSNRLDYPHDATGVALIALGAVREVRRVAGSGPSVRLLVVAVASAVAAFLIRGRRRRLARRRRRIALPPPPDSHIP